MLSLAAAAHLHVAAQPAACDGKTLADSRNLEFPYAVRPGGYCDGTAAFDHASALQLVSYTMGPVRFEPQQARMKLQTPLPPPGSPLKVIGVDKRPTGTYRFDAALSVSGLEIDLLAAIHPKGLTSQYLGFAAWSSLEGIAVYFPVVAGVPQPSDAPLLVFRAPTAVVQAAYEICVHGQACGPQQPWARDLKAGSLLELKLPKGPTARQVAFKVTVLGPGGKIDGDVFQLLIP